MQIRILAIFTLASVCVAANAQEKGNTIVAAYSGHRADVSTRTVRPGPIWQNGLSLTYSYNLTEHLAVLLDVSGHFRRGSLSDSGLVFQTKRDQYYFLGGVQYSPRPKSVLSPFLRILAGGSVFRGFGESRAERNTFMFDDAVSAALAAGGGFDVRLKPRLGIRIVPIEYMPTFFASHSQHNFRATFGVFYKW